MNPSSQSADRRPNTASRLVKAACVGVVITAWLATQGDFGAPLVDPAEALSPTDRIHLPITMVRIDRIAIAQPATAPLPSQTPAPLTLTPSYTPTAPLPTPRPTASPSPSPTAAPDCAAVPTFADGREPIGRLWVSPDGNDSAGDGSREAPLQTIGRAARLATPGTAIVLLAGEYPGGQYVEDLHGAAGAPIWIGGESLLTDRADDGDPPTVSVLAGESEGLHISRSTYVIVHDLRVRGSAQNGINADDGGDVDDPLASHHLLFQRLEISDVGGSGNQDIVTWKQTALAPHPIPEGNFHALRNTDTLTRVFYSVNLLVRIV